MMAKSVLLLLFVIVVRIAAGYVISTSDSDYLDAEECADKSEITHDIHFDDIFKDVLNAYRFDPEVRAAFNYLTSDEFQEKIQKLAGRAEYQAFERYLTNRNENLFILENEKYLKIALHTVAIQAEMMEFEDVNLQEITGGVHGLIVRILDKRIPLDTIRNSISSIIACDHKLQETIDRLRSSEFKYLLAQLRSTSEYKDLILTLDDYKIYLDDYLDVFLYYLKIDR